MTFYSDMSDLALDLITEFGSAVIIEQSSSGTFDPVAGTVTGSTISSISGYAAVFDYSLRDSGLGNADGTLIKVGDKKIMLAASGLSATPTIDDTIVADSVRYSVEHIIEFKPSDVDACYYEIQGRSNG